MGLETNKLPEVGAKAPEFTLPDSEGKLVSLASFAGKRWCCISILGTIRRAAPGRPARLLRRLRSFNRWMQ